MTDVALGALPKNIARLTGFEPADTQKAILYLAWQAREYLGDAERKEETTLTIRAYWCAEAASLLEAVRTLLERYSLDPTRQIAIDLVERSLAAAKAAVENGRIAARYYISSKEPRASDWDRQHTPKAISIFKRAAETARQETHRALVELCELFPDSMPTEE